MSLTGEHPSNYNCGHLVLERLRLHPDRICQIDAATGEEESYDSVLKRSIKLAQALRVFGLQPGDVVARSGPNHLDIVIPLYAALFNGLSIFGVDPYFKYERAYIQGGPIVRMLGSDDDILGKLKELFKFWRHAYSDFGFCLDEVRELFDLTKPKIVFCQNDSVDTFTRAAAILSLDIKFVTFDDGDHAMSKFLKIYASLEHEKDFKVAQYDVEKIYPFLLCTSGTSGKLKLAAFKNKSILLKDAMLTVYTKEQDKTVTNKSLVLSPNQWMSAFYAPISIAAFGGTLLMTSKYDNYIFNVDHVLEIINKYKPKNALFSASLIPSLILVAQRNDVDMTFFGKIAIAGAKLAEDIRQQLKKLLADTCQIVEPYGLTEMIGPIFGPSTLCSTDSCGRPTDMYNVKLVEPDTGVEIKEANVTGELLVKGPAFSCYYNNPEATAISFTEDGFYKTGDLLYRDKDNNYYYVDRIKTLIKMRGTHIYPTELEAVIRKHPGVSDVCVVGIDDLIDRERPAACVVRHKGSDVTAQEIKDLIASKLSDNKRLRGGVLFLDSLPYTSTGKVLRVKLREIAKSAERE